MSAASSVGSSFRKGYAMAVAEPVPAHPAERILRPGESALLDAWRDLVEANAAQVARIREFDEPEDYWAEGYAGATVSLDTPSSTDRTLAEMASPRDR